MIKSIRFGRSICPTSSRLWVLAILVLIASNLFVVDVAFAADKRPSARSTAFKGNKGVATVKSKKIKRARKTRQLSKVSKVEQPATCRSWLLMNANTGEILVNENGEQALLTASMVKILTSYLAAKTVREGRAKWDDIVEVTPHSAGVGGSQVYLKEGEQFTLRELVEAVLIKSANDASSAVARHIGGSVEGFVAQMNAEAQLLGLATAEFYTPHGLPPDNGGNADRMAAKDFAILTKHVIENYPELLEITSKSEAMFRDGSFRMRNHNHLLKSISGCDGFKTGFYSKAGYSISATAQRENLRMIAVVMGCSNRHRRDDQAAALIAQGFSQTESVQLVKRGDLAPETVRVSGGKPNPVSLVVAADLVAYLKKGEEQVLNRTFKPCLGLKAPVQANTTCGEMVAFIGEREIGRVALLVRDDVHKASLLQRLREQIGL